MSHIIKLHERMEVLGISLKPGTRVCEFRARDRLAGFFKMTAIRPDGRRRLLQDWQPNLITNNGLDNFGFGAGSPTSASGWLAYCRIGTGSTVPSFTDGAMDIHKAEVVTGSRTWGTSGVGGPPNYRFQRDVFTFAQGEATGNITEVGVGRSLAEGNLSTRALVVDGEGDPTTVPVLSDEELEVVYEIRTYFSDLTEQISTMTIDSVLYDTIRLPMLIASTANMNGTFNYGAGLQSMGMYKDDSLPNIGDHYGEPLDIMESVNVVRQAYSSGLHYRDSIGTAEVDEAEYGVKGVTAIRLIGYLSNWQMSFTQNLADYGIPHDPSNQLIVTCRHSWDRY